MNTIKTKFNGSFIFFIILFSIIPLLFGIIPKFSVFENPESYIHLHTILEFSSSTVAIMIFTLVWNIREYEKDRKYIYLGAFYLGSSIIGAAHILSYTGMPNFFTANGPEKAIIFWLGERFLAIVGVACFVFLPSREWNNKNSLLLYLLLFISANIYVYFGITSQESFPRTFIPEQGLTPFKIYSEYVLISISFVTFGSLLYFHRNKEIPKHIQWIALGIFISGMAEVLFTMYANVHDLVNIFGHLFKTSSLFFLYKGIFVTGIQIPYSKMSSYQIDLRNEVENAVNNLYIQEAQSKQILAASGDGIYGIDLNGNITFINEYGALALGYTAEDVIGKQAHSLIHHSHFNGAEYQKQNCPSINSLKNGESSRIDNEVFWKKDGSSFPVLYSTFPLKNIKNEITGGVISFVDVTRQKELFEKQEKALKESERLAQAKQQFMANMSHELRTPLHGILGFSAIGIRNINDPFKAKNSFEKIEVSCKRLQAVIDDILDFSKLEAGKMTVDTKEVNIKELLEETIHSLEPRADQKGLKIQLFIPENTPLFMITDPLRLGQIFLNLLSNAVKYTDVGNISILFKKDREFASFSFDDTGVGMSEDQMAKAFLPFEQVDGSMTRKQGGTGLGLPISRHIAELLNGTLIGKCSIKKGCSFEVRIPWKECSKSITIQQDTIVKEDGTILNEKIHILIAEDDEINQEVLRETLAIDGFTFHIVDNGLKAVREIESHPHLYDMVIMDIQMPEMDGLEATKIIKKIRRDLPVVGVSAHAFPEDRKKCLDAGMEDQLTKPLDPDMLVRTLISIYQKKR